MRCAEPATLPELFAAQAARTPDAAAVMFEDRVLSYAELDAHANRLAHHLQSLGVGPETIVGLLVERSPEMVVGLIGILKAGGAYLPLDPDYPRERLAFMLADAGAPGAGDASGAARPAARAPAAAQLVRLDADWPAIARQPDTAPPLELDPDHPAYVIYTSGSTGTPKGVVVDACARSLLKCSTLDDLRDLAEAAVLLLASIAFDSSIAGAFWRCWRRHARSCIRRAGAAAISGGSERNRRECSCQSHRCTTL